MTSEFITSEKLYGAFIAGAKATIAQKTKLNIINGFPVADNDVGGKGFVSFLEGVTGYYMSPEKN